MASFYSSDGAQTPAELAQAWAASVAGNREQAERVREDSDGGDHYAPIAAAFRADPHREDDLALDALREIASPNDALIDVGAGAGRFALPLALHARRVIAVEPSAAMRQELSAAQIDYGIDNLEVRSERWPSDDPALDGIADVALISHVAYDIEPIGEFLDTLERAASRECAALLFDRSPGSMFWQLWPTIHGEELVHLPAGREFIALLEARGAEVDVREISAPGRGGRQRFQFDSMSPAVDWAQRRLWLADDSPRLPRLRDAVSELLIEHDGGWTLPDQPTQMLIRWRPA